MAPESDAQVLLQAVWPEGLSVALAELVDLDLASRLLADFKLGVVLRDDGGVPRLALSDEGDPEGWAEAVAARWGGEVAAFLEGGPAGCRRMLDTAGDGTARLFLDDLHAHGCEEMCRVLHLPGGSRSHFTRHPVLPAGLLPRGSRALAGRLTGGIWGLHWAEDRCVGGLWISESRWRGDAVRTAALVVAELALPLAWSRAREALGERGWRLYPDAVELFADGHAEVTLGWVRG